MGKNGNGIYVSDGNGKGMVMGIKSLKWEGFGTKNLFPHISTVNNTEESCAVNSQIMQLQLQYVHIWYA